MVLFSTRPTRWRPSPTWPSRTAWWTASSPEIDRSLAAEVVDAGGLWVIPGMVDGHVHVGGERATWDPALGFRMLALAGVTTGIDFGSTPETLFDGMQRLGAGINIGGLMVLRPGSTIPRDDPPPPEVRSIVSEALRRGATASR